MRILILCVILISSFAQAKSERTHLKCFIKTIDGDQRIIQYEFRGEQAIKANDPAAFRASLTGTNAFSSDGVTPVAIKKAVECVAVNKKFINSTAQKLDKNAAW